MSRQEKHAWFNLGVFASATALFALIIPRFGLLGASGSFGICVLWILTPFLFYPKGNAKRVLDERERTIQRQAWQVGRTVFWLLFVSSFMIAWGLHQKGNITVPPAVFPLFVNGGLVVVVVVESISTLVLCKRGVLHV